ncbi:ATP-binding protein [Saccharothrix violaceirubra]|uniref:histidine kinase n=1 Tax=Saccharothrix violaceirubra TaxID=413306 RepID=A0A7W7WVD4_9PSEU|nr:ATP-binding protein [Saccharothrix violaceirubra]MBB4965195.1 signal transduction histidine kinase [Saccharothrix violaceirubra]
MSTELLRLVARREPDVFLLRKSGREVAAAVGLDGQDQVRVATALSDLGREVVRLPEPVVLRFGLVSTPGPALVIVVETGQADGPGWDTARRLMDRVEVAVDTVTLVKTLPAGHDEPDAARLTRLRRELATSDGADALDELRAQNQELLETLESLEAKRVELERLNDELERTNQGVLALHKELSDELEQTNQGVVALYAELEEKSTQLREAAEARTRFWSNISHELRSPVNSVVGLARLLGAPGGDPLTDEQRRQVDLINNAGLTLLALVNELLDTAKAESGNLEPRYTPVDLVPTLTQLRDAMRPVVRPGVDLVVDPVPSVPLVTDEVMLVRILRNLLSNAAKFTETGSVRLGVYPDDGAGTLRLVVTDTGIGIPSRELGRIFEEFYQVPGRLQVGAGGTGLGLPYARRLARILGGDLTVTSEPGTGTTATLRLPVSVPDDLAVETVLLVGPDDEVRARLRAALGGVARTVVEVADGRAALEARADRPDLVVSAVDVPLVGGMEILSVLRGDPACRSVPVVLVGRDLDSAVERTASTLGAAVLAADLVAPESLRQAVRVARNVLRGER